MEEWVELSDDGHDDSDAADDGNARNDLRLAFDHGFQIEIYRFDSCKERLRSLFDQVLLSFLRDKSARNCIRPIPALCSEGRPIDLFKLFWLVRKIGGYDAISKNNLWGFVSEECGSSFRVIASVKLVYMKYLYELDQWLRQVFSKRALVDDYSGFVKKLDKLSRELEITFRGLSPDEQTQKDAKDRTDVTQVIGESELHLSPNTETRVLVENNVNFYTGEEGKLHGGNDISWLSSGSIGEKIICEVGNLDGCIDGDFAENFVNEVNGYSKGQTDAHHEKSYNAGSGDIVASAKKIIEKVVDKVLSCGENITAAADGDNEGFSVQGNNDSCISANKVINKTINKPFDHSEKITDNEQRFSAQQSLDNMIPPRSDIGNMLGSRKRKRQFQSYSGMLSWLNHVAKHSNDPSVGLIPGCSKWSDYGNEDFWVQALSVRETLLIRRHANKAAGEALWKDQQKKPKMHPSMYEDDVLDHRPTEKLRFSTRIPMTKSHLCPCCNSRAFLQSKHIIHQETNVVGLKEPIKSVVKDAEELPSNKNTHELSDVPPEKEVSVGPLFQAEVPEWTGVSSESDSKWLGTRVWPLEDGEENSMLELDPIGKGRHHPCNCPFPDSVECVRFHVAEKRLKLKRELGILFYHWQFNRMGEEVSLSWTEEEEMTFKDNMRSYATFINKFWNNACRFLPSKTREKLVSYYFNVYLVQRRSYQNRVTPKDVDSDDDEKECGCIGGSFGCKALSIPGSSSILCTLNKESNELV